MLDFRRVAEDDFDAVWSLFHEVVRQGETYAYAPDTERAEAHRIWMDAPAATYVAVRNGRVVGTYFIRQNQPSLGDHVCNAGYIVRSDVRGQGIGRAMCKHSLAQAKELGFLAMQFNLVVSTNAGAVDLWKSLGFSVVGVLPKAFRHAGLGLVDAVVMYRLLD